MTRMNLDIYCYILEYLRSWCFHYGRPQMMFRMILYRRSQLDPDHESFMKLSLEGMDPYKEED